MKLILSLLLISSIALADEEEKVVPPSAETACKLFGEVQDKLKDKRYDLISRFTIIWGGITLAGIGFGTIANIAWANSEQKNAERIDQIIKKHLSPEDYQKHRAKMADLNDFSKIKRRDYKRAIKMLIGYTGIGTVMMVGADALTQNSIRGALKDIVDGFATPLGDGTMTGFFMKNPDKFMELDKTSACIHLGADKESPSAPILRQAVLEMHNLVLNEEQETPEAAQNNSDVSINNKADLTSGNKTKENSKTNSKAE